MKDHFRWHVNSSTYFETVLTSPCKKRNIFCKKLLSIICSKTNKIWACGRPRKQVLISKSVLAINSLLFMPKKSDNLQIISGICLKTSCAVKNKFYNLQVQRTVKNRSSEQRSLLYSYKQNQHITLKIMQWRTIRLNRSSLCPQILWTEFFVPNWTIAVYQLFYWTLDQREACVTSAIGLRQVAKENVNVFDRFGI